MNIFFIGSIRGGRANQPNYALIVKALQRYGVVHSQFVSDETLSKYGETSLTDQEIFERETEALLVCHVVVAEVTTPSLGVGYLIARATSESKKVIAFYYGEDTLKLSAMIKGDPNVDVCMYKNESDIERILASTLG